MNVIETRTGSVEVVSRQRLAQCRHWANAFASQHKDRRYYELVEDTIHPEIDYRYFAIKDGRGEIGAIQPFFILDQDLLVGMSPSLGMAIDAVRALWPRFMHVRTMMVGCVAGEAHLDDADDEERAVHAERLADAIVPHARALGTPLIVLKEFPKTYRGVLECFRRRGFTRVPSMPMTRLNIEYASFDAYMRQALNSATRKKLRKKFDAAARAAPIEMSVYRDVTPMIDDVYALYLQVYRRSKLHFEKLTREYFCTLGRLMPDKVRFFVWRQGERMVAFCECMVHDQTIFAEYLGLDYLVAFDLHLYHYVFRDIVTWAMANGCRWFQSTGLNYDPKLHLRQRLAPIDLYVRHTSPVVNAGLKRALPLLEPTRYDPTLPKFANYAELWGSLPGER